MSNVHDTSVLASSTKTKAYSLSLSTISEMLSTAVNKLRATNAMLESEYNKSQQSSSGLSVETTVRKILGHGALVDSSKLYQTHGQQLFSIKAAINKRSEILAHLNIMLTNVGQKAKIEGEEFEIGFSHEEDLFYNFLKIFHAKLFESPLFRKICNEIWRVAVLFLASSTAPKSKSAPSTTSSKHMVQLFREHLDLYAQGICEISMHPENYPLHRAVFENDLPLIRRLCVGERFSFASFVRNIH